MAFYFSRITKGTTKKRSGNELLITGLALYCLSGDW
jgi:hypothetical protein